jgi:S-DNA-T family DNA segregation ATPase FtsK/SpoIIIE
MDEALFTTGLRQALRDIIALSADRQASEESVEAELRAAEQRTEQAFREAIDAINTTWKTEKRDAEREYRQRTSQIERTYTDTRDQMQQHYEVELASIDEKAEHNIKEIKRRHEEARWLADSVYEMKEGQPRLTLEKTKEEIDIAREHLDQLREQSARLLKRYHQRVPAIEHATVQPEVPDLKTDPNPTVRTYINRADQVLLDLAQIGIARLFLGPGLMLLMLMILAGAVTGYGLSTKWADIRMLAIVGGGTLVVEIIITVILHTLAKRKVREVYGRLSREMHNAEQAMDVTQRWAEVRRQHEEEELVQRRDSELREADEKYLPLNEKVAERREHHIKRIHERYPARLEELAQQREADLADAEAHYKKRLTDAREAHDRDTTAARATRDRDTAAYQERYSTDWQALETRWKQGMAAAHATIDQINTRSAELFPDWRDPRWNDWSTPDELIGAIRFGALKVNMADIEGGITHDERLLLDHPNRFQLPAMLAFPNDCSLLLETGNDGRPQAMQTLQMVMMRLLTALPAGKVRFTIIDPVGLGQNFAGFMHLADWQDALVGRKIWTETRHIEQRLTDLTEHMENVIQKYLRNEYQTIGEYNEYAGEIAEPYRFLVIADFPVNFTDTAAHRLASIVNSGKRCGVYTLIAMDTRHAVPPGVQVKDLYSASVTIRYQKDRFVWQDDDFKDLPLELDAPPGEDFVTNAMQVVGKAAKDSSRVEVPFRVISPDDENLWTRDSGPLVEVPLGRAGATKLQNLELGQGTSQHALIAGKTGSGKSTLLHVLITNLALWYSPDQIEFYLVDFKKGVEFKTYARHDLPHARAVAIESDREFGLSVLQRIDQELKHRGNRFRDLGVQDLPSFRKASPDEPMPRVLLIIDEFQELFVEDDKIGQDAALLLDRLVRQGRAFGIHVLLGSQTLGGAYSLARSTLEQMAVRIALQCSEADSYLILSDDNAAARLLSRPGEAIYNDANGLIEGNSPFQICFLDESVREECLSRIRDRAMDNGFARDEPQIVFEGNVPADLRRNQQMRDLLAQPVNGSAPMAPKAWLGEAIAIKEPTAAQFRRQSGSNLIIVGQRDEAALGILGAGVLGLAAQFSPQQARFIVLDGTPEDSPYHGALAKSLLQIPHTVQRVLYRDVANVMEELAVDVQQRQDADATDAPAIFLVVNCLQRYRQLRFVEDYSFSMDDDKPVSTDKHFAAILREGPAFGIHCMIWCDTVANLERTFERQTIREFEMRVLFQMGATDSSNLIDSPIAAKLGLRRALYSSEETGTLEKFRPYALPEADVLEPIIAALNQR